MEDYTESSWNSKKRGLLRKALGSLKDVAAIGIAKLSPVSVSADLDLAVVKATKHGQCLPKEKHVATVLEATKAKQREEGGEGRAVASRLFLRGFMVSRMMETRDWTVALKTLTLNHQIITKGEPSFIAQLRHDHSSIFYIESMSLFKDPIAMEFSEWIRKYSPYLVKRLECSAILDQDARREDPQTLLKHLPHLQKLLNRVVNLTPQVSTGRNSLILYALRLVATDSFHIYDSMAARLCRLLDRLLGRNLQGLPRNDALHVVSVCRNAEQHSEGLSQFYDTCKILELENNLYSPDSVQKSQAYIKTIEEYIKKCKSHALSFEKQASLPKDECAEFASSIPGTGSEDDENDGHAQDVWDGHCPLKARKCRSVHCYVKSADQLHHGQNHNPFDSPSVRTGRQSI